MIIDFRARPPYKSFLKLSLYKPWRPLPEDPAEWGAFELGREPNITADAHDMDAFVKEMDDNGIVKAVLMGRHADNFGIVDNDELYELTQKYPGRFFPFAGINPREEGAVEEVERCISKMGFKGISVDPGWLNPPLKGDDPIFTPVYDKCAELGGILVMSVSAALGPDLTYSDPIIVQHVATRYPGMKIVVAHGCWPHVERMLAVAMRCPNVYLVPDCYVYIDCMPFADTYIEAANIPHRNIIAMQGPFSFALNQAMMEQFHIRWLVTKDGGAAGGFDEKAAAASAAGAQLVVIRRPPEQGETASEVLKRCKEMIR